MRTDRSLVPVRLRRISAIVTTVGAVVLLAACSATGANYQEAAVKAIEQDAGKQLGDMKATCDKPADKPKVDDTFACIAVTKDGKVANFNATIAAGKKVNVISTNVLNDADLTAVEQTAVAALAEQIGAELDPSIMDCGAGPVIFETKGLTCALTDPDSKEIYDAQITIGDLKDLKTLKVNVADAPRAS
jgi:hypothetical protein